MDMNVQMLSTYSTIKTGIFIIVGCIMNCFLTQHRIMAAQLPVLFWEAARFVTIPTFTC